MAPRDRTWQIAADVVFPNHLPADIVAGVPVLPQQLIPQSRIPVQRRDLGGGAEAFVAPGDDHRVPGVANDMRFAVAVVTIRLTSSDEDAAQAAATATPLLDRVLESLSFQMQTALQIQALEILDLSGNPRAGDTREFSRCSGWATPTFRPTSVPMQSLVGKLVPDLALDIDPSDRRANRALDWYLKALSAGFEADHFMFLWIAAEILAADSPLSVHGPYRCPKGHEIATCPECGSETARRIQGPSMKRYLSEGFGLSNEAAAGVWEARQILHGAHAFDSAIMDRLPDWSQQLRYVVVTDLKRRLDIPEDEPPIAALAGLSISPFMGIGGTREVTARDLDPLAVDG